jgi:hypothetical protein
MLTKKTHCSGSTEARRMHTDLRSRCVWRLARGRRVSGVISLACIVLIAGTGPLKAANPSAMQPFIDNTLVCQDRETKAVCHVWFNGDGSYYVFYDLGPQTTPASVTGPFQYEGREGMYSLHDRTDVVEVCLRPATPVVPLAAQRAHEYFSGAECYPLAVHAVGARWQQSDRRGRQYTFWLMAGR